MRPSKALGRKPSYPNRKGIDILLRYHQNTFNQNGPTYPVLSNWDITHKNAKLLSHFKLI